MKKSNKTKKVVMYTSRYCPFCVRAKLLLVKKEVDLKELFVDQDPELRRAMMQKSGRHTVPQIWIGEQHIGGCDELLALDRANKLDGLITD